MLQNSAACVFFAPIRSGLQKTAGLRILRLASPNAEKEGKF
jgi:hypothetical protein